MSLCTKCGNSLDEGESFCRSCGARAGAEATRPAGAAARSGVTENDLAVFIGKNAEKYLSRFKNFRQGGEDSFTVTWHWPAFLFSFWWTLYRKMYGWALLVFFLGCVPYLGLVVMVAFGLCGNYLYYRHAKKKVLDVKALPGTDRDRSAALARAGGVNNVAVVVAPLLLVAVVAVLAAIAIPQFAMYRQRAADMTAKQEIQQACSVGTEFFKSHPDTMLVEPDDLLYAGLRRTPEVEMTLLDGRRGFFSISARHVHGKMTYVTDPNCFLTEEEGASR